jgi:hypothetical protein
LSSHKTPFLDQKTAYEAYEESRKWLRRYFDPCDEFERIARGRPSTKISPELPKVTDQTTASIIQESPKRVVQQEPSVLIECKDYPEYAKMADIEVRDTIIPFTRAQGNYLQKSWNMVGKAATYGRATSYRFLTQYNGRMTVDFVIPYVKDVLTEKGKVFAADSNISFMRSWYQQRDLKAIINKERIFKEKNPKYVSDWDLKALSQFMEAGASQKPGDLQTPAEKEKGGDSGGYEVIHAFQKGAGGEFYSFAPRFDNGKPLRTKVNKDPRGNIPLDHLYCNIDLSNPLGRGQVESAGGIQNLMDQQLQMYQFMSALMQQPPIIKYGQMSKNTPMMPNAVWDGGNNRQTNGIEVVKFDNTQIANFTNNAQFLQSKIFALNNTQDTSIGADNGVAGQSKTQAGVQATQAKLGVSDNYVRKMYEGWVSDDLETAINMLFSEVTSDRAITLKPEDIKDVMKTPAAQYMVEQNKLKIPYSKMKDVVLSLEVNPNSSEVKEDTDNVEKLTEVYQLLAQDPTMQDKKEKLLKVLITEIGAEGTEELFPEEELDENGQPAGQQEQKQPQMTPDMVQQMVMEIVDAKMAEKPQESDEEKLIKSFGIKFADLPDDTKRDLIGMLDIKADDQFPDAHKRDLDTLTAFDKAEDMEYKKEQDQLSSEQTQAQQDHTMNKDMAAQQQAQAQQEHSQKLDVFNATKPPEPKVAKEPVGAAK